MTATLTRDVQAFYRTNGYHYPIRVLGAERAADTVREIRAFEAARPDLSKRELRHGLFRFKPHLIFGWLDSIVHDEAVLDAIESIIGPDIMVWASALFIKDARDSTHIGWHQDSTTYNLDGDDLVTAWIALTDAGLENAAMRVVPGTHELGLVSHTDTWDEANDLSRGEEVDLAIDEAETVSVVLEAGEMSLHHVHTVHGSPPNRSDRPRIGYAVRYMPPRMRHLGGPASAMLARGQDRFGHHEHEPRPQATLDDAARAAHARAMELRQQAVFAANPGRAVQLPH